MVLSLQERHVLNKFIVRTMLAHVRQERLVCRHYRNSSSRRALCFDTAEGALAAGVPLSLFRTSFRLSSRSSSSSVNSIQMTLGSLRHGTRTRKRRCRRAGFLSRIRAGRPNRQKCLKNCAPAIQIPRHRATIIIKSSYELLTIMHIQYA